MLLQHSTVVQNTRRILRVFASDIMPHRPCPPLLEPSLMSLSARNMACRVWWKSKQAIRERNCHVRFFYFDFWEWENGEGTIITNTVVRRYYRPGTTPVAEAMGGRGDTALHLEAVCRAVEDVETR